MAPTSKCAFFAPFLLDFAHHRLEWNSPIYAEIQEHLQNCPWCSKQVQRLEASYETSDFLIQEIRSFPVWDNFDSDAAQEEEDLVQQLLERMDAEVPAPTTKAWEERISEKLVIERPAVDQGGMGVIFKGRHADHGEVAVKFIKDDQKGDHQQLFEREAQISNILKIDGPDVHHNIVTVWESNTHPQHGPFLVMQYYTGRDLKKSLAAEPLDLCEACELISQAAEGLAHMAQQGLVHRDIKPANLFFALDAEGHPRTKILDLGIAYVFAPNPDPCLAKTYKFLADTNSIAERFYTWDYYDPALRGGALPTPASDIYSLGRVLFEALAGTLPDHEESTAKALKEIRAKKNLPAIPKPILVAIDKMQAEDPKDRYQNPLEIKEILQPYTRCPVSFGWMKWIAAVFVILLLGVAGQRAVDRPNVDVGDNREHFPIFIPRELRLLDDQNALVPLPDHITPYRVEITDHDPRDSIEGDSVRFASLSPETLGVDFQVPPGGFSAVRFEYRAQGPAPQLEAYRGGELVLRIRPQTKETHEVPEVDFGIELVNSDKSFVKKLGHLPAAFGELRFPVDELLTYCPPGRGTSLDQVLLVFSKEFGSPDQGWLEIDSLQLVSAEQPRENSDAERRCPFLAWWDSLPWILIGAGLSSTVVLGIGTWKWRKTFGTCQRCGRNISNPFTKGT